VLRGTTQTVDGTPPPPPPAPKPVGIVTEIINTIAEVLFGLPILAMEEMLDSENDMNLATIKNVN
jgi:hypothetical protein